MGSVAAGPCRSRTCTQIGRMSLLLLLAASASVGALALDRDRSIAQLYYTFWSEKDGAPGAISALAQTQDGYLWIGSERGLFRFDGVNFEEYSPPPGVNMPSHAIYSLMATPDGGLWIAFEPNGLGFYKDGSLTVFNRPDQLPDSTVHCFARDSDGRIWAGTETGLAFRQGDRWISVGQEWNFTREMIRYVFVDREGTLWAATVKRIVYLKRGSKRFEVGGPITDAVTTLAQAPNGRVWLADDGPHVARPVPTEGRDSMASGPSIVTDGLRELLFDRDGALWMTSEDLGIMRVRDPAKLETRRYGARDRELESFGPKDGFPAGYAYKLLEDHEGNIWVGCSNGVIRIRHNQVIPVSLPQQYIRLTLLTGTQGDLWVGTISDKPLLKIRGESMAPETGGNIVSSVLRDANGDVWWGSRTGIWRQRDSAFTYFRLPKDAEPGRMWDLMQTEENRGIWVKLGDDGLVRFNNGTWNLHDWPRGVPSVGGTFDHGPSASYRDPSGRFWLGYTSAQIYLVDRGHPTEYSKKDGLDLGRIKVIRGQTDHIWAGGELGLDFFSNGRFWNVQPASGEPFGAVSGIIETPDTGLWLNEMKGIVQIPPEEIRQVLADPSHRVSCRRFDYLDGLPGTPQMAYTNSTAARTSDGRLWFATDSGLVWIDPAHLTKNPIPPPVSIFSISSENGRKAISGPIRFAAWTHTVEIHYAGLSLSIPERVQFRYKLEGVDKDWQNVGTRRQAYYTNLGPGSYRFRVIACNNDGVWNETGAFVDFYIAPAYYQTAWFRLLCGAAFLLLLWGLYQLRLRHLHRQFNTRLAERARIVQELRKIIDSIPGFVCAMNPEGEVELFNRQFLEYFGKTFEEMRGGWTTNDSIHPEDRARSVAIFKNSIQTGTPHEVEQRCRRADGVYRWFQRSARPVRDTDGRITGWYVLITDIEDRKRAEDELQRKEAFLAEGQHLSSTGTFSWRLDTDEVVFSEEACRIFEFELNAPVTFERISGRIHPDDNPMLSEKMTQARSTGDNQDYEIRLRMANGSVKYVHISSHATRHQDGHLEYIGAIQDVTERRLAEEALNKLRSELAHMARVTSLGALTASITHEVSQPLSGILTNASTCLRMLDANPPNLDGALETTHRTIRDGKRASEVIVRLRLLFSKKEAKAETMDLNEAASEILALCADELQRNRVIVRQELASDLPPVAGDRVQLQQVILNLLRNASDAMSDVKDRPRELVIRTEKDKDDRSEEDDCVRLTVQDTGVGIAPQDMERLFEAFYTTKTDGMGIGLSVSHSIIERHGGRLWATPNDGPGATFSFSIPCKLDHVANSVTAG